MNTEQYLEPLKYYERELKETHRQNVEDCFAKLSDESHIDIGSNKITCTKYYAEKKALDKLKKSLTATKAGIVIMIILMVVGFVLGLILLITGSSSGSGVSIGVGVGLLVTGVIALVVWLAVFRPKKKDLQKIVDKKQKVADKLQNEAYEQVRGLNNLFRPNLAVELMEKTAPLIDFDEYLSSKTLKRVVNQFKDKLDADKTHSTLVVQSGNINTNPFILRQKLVMEMVPEVYTGTLVITYTKTVSDGEGGSKTITVSQTLVAHVTKPRPQYTVYTGLNYYTDAADKLSFYRTPAGMEGLSEKQIQRRTNKEDRENQRKAEKAVKKGENYTKFANSKFEAYINSEKRNNELEYRLLFTPLAQNNFVYSLSKHDDIYYDKNGCINSISTTHDKDMDYSGDISNYYHFDYEVIKANFVSYNMKFFEALYFDFVPLLNIPLFFQHQSAPFVDTEEEDVISYYEAEVLINKFEPDLFKPEHCDTDVILKPTVSGNNIIVNSYGYQAIPRVELVPTFGGDGRTHLVPVDYLEYKEVHDAFNVNLINNDSEIVDNKNGSEVLYRKYRAHLLNK